MDDAGVCIRDSVEPSLGMTEVVCGTSDGDSESEVVSAGVTADPGSGVWPGDCSDVSMPGSSLLVELLGALLSSGTVAKGTLICDIAKEVVSRETLLIVLDSSLRVAEDTGGGLPVGSTDLLRVDESKVDCGGSDNGGVVVGS